MKSYEQLLFNKEPIDQLAAYDAIVKLYKHYGLTTPKMLVQPNMLACIDYVRKNKLVATSIKKFFIEKLASLQEDIIIRTFRGEGWVEENIYNLLLNRTLLKSNVTICPQLSKVGFNYLTKDKEIARIWMPVYQNISFFIPLENLCIVSETPIHIHGRMEKSSWRQDQDELFLHRDSGKPAIEIIGAESLNLYYLNNISLANKWFKCPAEQLDAVEILNVKNVDARMQLMKYVGMEHLLSKLPCKVIDTLPPYYELLMIKIDITDRRREDRFSNFDRSFNQREMECIYLKMLNPSVGTFHVESVHPQCRTVEQALKWRASNLTLNQNEEWSPEQLT